MPRRVCSTGKYAKDYFNRHGELRHIKKLRFWPLERVLHEKYEFPREEVRLCAAWLPPWGDSIGDSIRLPGCSALMALFLELCNLVSWWTEL